VSRVRLRVDVDEPDRAFVQGETVTGSVVVEADEDCDCSSLDVFLRWTASGDVNEAEGDGERVSVAAGVWKAGDRRRFPWSLRVPTGPPTHEGRRFAVGWMVRTEASIDWAVNAKAGSPVTVLPGPARAPGLVEEEEAGGFETGCAVATMLLILVGAILFLSSAAPEVGAVAAVLGGLVLLWAIPRAIAYRRLGRIRVEAGPVPVVRGEELACRLVLVPRKDVAPAKVVAILRAVESSVKGAGKQRQVRREKVVERTVDLEGPERLSAGSEGTWAGVIPVPGDAPPSFEAGPHGVAWTLEVEVDLPWLPDPSWDLKIEVA
jgi:hypothetical protein